MTVAPMPMKITTSSERNVAATTQCPRVIAALRIVNSLKNGPNGGEPVIAKNPARSSDAGDRHALERAAHFVGRLAPVRALDVGRAQEEDALGERRC